MLDELFDGLERLHERVEDENRTIIGPYTGRQLMIIAQLGSLESPPISRRSCA